MRPPKVPPEDRHKLDEELEIKLKRAGPHYAHATARDFAKGGKYNAQPKRAKYALT